jgi:hypothetical protein
VDIGKVVEQGTGKDRNERRARELAELLQELRVMLPDVQVCCSPSCQRCLSRRGPEL